MKFYVNTQNILPTKGITQTNPIGGDLISGIPSKINNLQSSEIDDKIVDVVNLSLNKLLIKVNIKEIKDTVLSTNHNLKNLIGYTVTCVLDKKILDFATKRILTSDTYIKIIDYVKDYSTLPDMQQYFITFHFRSNENPTQELYTVGIPLKALYLHGLMRFKKK